MEPDTALIHSVREILPVVILIVFTLLVVVAAVSTSLRVIRYRRRGQRPPRLLPRDRDLFLGLALPFIAVLVVRAIPEWRQYVVDEIGHPQIWWSLVTGLPPIYAMGRFVWFELRVIERDEDRKSS